MRGEIVSMSRADYDRLTRVNWSTLRHMRRSPAHYRHALLEKQVDTDAMRRGRAAHLAVFEPDRFRAECAVWDGGSRRGKDWEKFVKDNSGRELLTMSMWEDAKAIGQAARADAVAARYLANGRAEQTILWEHANGAPAKGRVDFMTDALVDLKTTRDASPEAFGKQMHSLGTLAQCAYYSDGILAITGKRLPSILVAVEVDAPHAVAVYRVSEDQLELGRMTYLPLLDRLSECQGSNSWPAYGADVQDLIMPLWSMPADEDYDGLDLNFPKEHADAT